jgi:hypothetical protein
LPTALDNGQRSPRKLLAAVVLTLKRPQIASTLVEYIDAPLS